MRFSAAVLLAAMSLAFAAPGYAADAMTLKHKDLACAACHGTPAPTKMAGQAACIQCHGQYKGKVVPNADYNPDRSPRRPVIEVNPHDSHFGDVRCTACHREHAKSPKTVCNSCHTNFRLEAK